MRRRLVDPAPKYVFVPRFFSPQIPAFAECGRIVLFLKRAAEWGGGMDWLPCIKCKTISGKNAVEDTFLEA